MKNTAIFLLCFPALRAACLRSDREDFSLPRSTRDERFKAFSEADEFAKQNEGRKNSCEKSLGGGKGKVTYHPAKDGEDAMWVLSFGRRGELGWSKTSGKWTLDYKGMKGEGLRLAHHLLDALEGKKPKCLHLPPDEETFFKEYRDAKDKAIDEMVKAFSEADKFAAEKNKRWRKGQCEKGLTGEKGWKVTYHPAKDGKDAMCVLSFGRRGELGWSKTSAGKWYLDYKGMKGEGLQLARDLLDAVKTEKPKCLHLPPDKVAEEMATDFLKADDSVAEFVAGAKYTKKELTRGTVVYYPSDKAEPDRVYLFFHPYGDLKWTRSKTSKWEFNIDQMDQIDQMSARKLVSALGPRVTSAKHLRLPTPKKRRFFL